MRVGIESFWKRIRLEFRSRVAGRGGGHCGVGTSIGDFGDFGLDLGDGFYFEAEPGEESYSLVTRQES